jgi:hypothetical protein
VCRYDTNRFRLTVRRRNGGAGAEFEANITLVDASGYDLIEIDEWSTLRAGLGNLDSLNLLNWRAGVIDHANDCECPLVLASVKDNQSDRASDVQKKPPGSGATKRGATKRIVSDASVSAEAASQQSMRNRRLLGNHRGCRRRHDTRRMRGKIEHGITTQTVRCCAGCLVALVLLTFMLAGPCQQGDPGFILGNLNPNTVLVGANAPR